MENKPNYIAIILIFIVIFSVIKISNLNKEKNNLENELSYCEDAIDEANDNLEQANNNIEELNSIIEDAQSYAWSSYGEMGEALENLYTLDTISY